MEHNNNNRFINHHNYNNMAIINKKVETFEDIETYAFEIVSKYPRDFEQFNIDCAELVLRIVVNKMEKMLKLYEKKAAEMIEEIKNLNSDQESDFRKEWDSAMQSLNSKMEKLKENIKELKLFDDLSSNVKYPGDTCL